MGVYYKNAPLFDEQPVWTDTMQIKEDVGLLIANWVNIYYIYSYIFVINRDERMVKTTERVLGMYFSALGILILLLLIIHMDMEADARTMLVSREYNNDIVIQMCIEHVLFLRLYR